MILNNKELNEALSVICPYCRAEVGQLCQNANAHHPRVSSHPERLRAIQMQRAETSRGSAECNQLARVS